jgi:penicillin-insensitive murein DD-endopeptidase
MYRLFFYVFLIAASASGRADDARAWGRPSSPALLNNGASLSIGNYTSGCLAGAVALPLQGHGYQVMRVSRQRYWGHPNLVQFIQSLGAQSADRQLGTLLVGDLGQVRGGPMISGHRSHQTGLDVDIWFLLYPEANRRLLSSEEREQLNADSMVDMTHDRINLNWRPANEHILQLAASHPEVERIFVNASIKKALCEQRQPGDREWLRKIRPWYKHDDHFHVRLKCPAASPQCNAQDPLPAGDGCDASLAWWFSEEAKNPAKNPSPPPPPLPALCDQVLAAP